MTSKSPSLFAGKWALAACFASILCFNSRRGLGFGDDEAVVQNVTHFKFFESISELGTVGFKHILGFEAKILVCKAFLMSCEVGLDVIIELNAVFADVFLSFMCVSFSLREILVFSEQGWLGGLFDNSAMIPPTRRGKGVWACLKISSFSCWIISSTTCSMFSLSMQFPLVTIAFASKFSMCYATADLSGLSNLSNSHCSSILFSHMVRRLFISSVFSVSGKSCKVKSSWELTKIGFGSSSGIAVCKVWGATTMSDVPSSHLWLSSELSTMTSISWKSSGNSPLCTWLTTDSCGVGWEIVQFWLSWDWAGVLHDCVTMSPCKSRNLVALLSLILWLFLDLGGGSYPTTK